MGKIPYLYRRKNVFYFRLVIPTEYQSALDFREITVSLRTQDKQEAIPQALKLAAKFKAILHDLKTGKKQTLCRSDFIASVTNTNHRQIIPSESVTPSQNVISTKQIIQTKAPLLSVVVDDFLNHYDRDNRAMLKKLNAALPVIVELIGNKPVNQILQIDINKYFEDVQQLPGRGNDRKFKGMTYREKIAANDGDCISEATYLYTYQTAASCFIQWACLNYKDQGFPELNAKGGIYRGTRTEGINKQRAMKHEELQKLFINPKMKKYATNPETVHYFWLQLIGLYTGARINEVCQLNPFEDIKQDSATDIHYFHFTDESESIESVDKSIKTNSSRRIVPIHSKLIELGFLDYVSAIKKQGHKILFPAWQPRGGKACHLCPLGISSKYGALGDIS